MAYVSVEVDIDEFATDELVAELIHRIKLETGRKKLKDFEILSLREELEKLNNLIVGDIIRHPSVGTLEDKMKAEHIFKVWDKYTSQEFETLLPE